MTQNSVFVGQLPCPSMTSAWYTDMQTVQILTGKFIKNMYIDTKRFADNNESSQDTFNCFFDILISTGI